MTIQEKFKIRENEKQKKSATAPKNNNDNDDDDIGLDSNKSSQDSNNDDEDDDDNNNNNHNQNQNRTKFNQAIDKIEVQEEGGEKPFNGPMMTKKLILRLDTCTGKNIYGWDQTLIYQTPNGKWVQAVYHEIIRLDLITKSKLNGEYGQFRPPSPAPSSPPLFTYFLFL